MNGQRWTLLILSAAFFLAVIVTGCAEARYPRALHDLRAAAAWVDARVAGAYVCSASAEIARLEASGGTPDEFSAWEKREWGAALDASEALDAGMRTIVAFHDAGEPDAGAAEAAMAVARTAEAINALLSALDANDVAPPTWVKKGIAP